MHDLGLIATLAGGLSAALVLGYVTQRLGLSPIVGYLLAGILVGPHTPGFVADTAMAEQLAEIGVILLMFGVGLQFHLEELLAVRRVAVPGAIVQSAVSTVLGMAVAHGAGWSWSAGLVFGIALSVASTVVLIRVLSDFRRLHTPAGHIAVGWLVVEDLFTVIVLVILPLLFGAGAAGSGASLAISLAITGLKVATLVAFTLIVGTRAIPWVLTVLVLAVGIALASAEFFGVSMALGAFLAGMVVGRSEYSLRAASEALPMRDAFAVLFFVSVGMLLDPRYLLQAPALQTSTLAIVVLGKPLVAVAVVILLGYPLSVALTVGAALGQIGEFSFIVAALGRDLGVLSIEAMNTMVAVSIVSIVLNPLIFRTLPLVQRLASGSRIAGAPDVHATSAQPTGEHAKASFASRDRLTHRAIVVGYGPTGRTLTRLLDANGLEPCVIEMNIETVRGLREQGICAVYGDATLRQTLEAAGAPTARSLILTADVDNAREVIRLARELNPRLQVLARTAYLRDLDSLKTAGADLVFSGEGEVALALTAAILHRLGATPEQMDRERERVHQELFG
jgi:CPA2 family monovalent cation:H+ antiporter-2